MVIMQFGTLFLSRRLPFFAALAVLGSFSFRPLPLYADPAEAKVSPQPPARKKTIVKPSGPLRIQSFHLPYVLVIKAKGSSLKKVLEEEAGISFPDGSSTAFVPGANLLIARNTAEQLARIETYLESPEEVSTEKAQLTVINEVVSVEADVYNRWMSENQIPGSGNDFRALVRDWEKKGQARVVELETLTSRSGNRAKAESVRFWPYPTNFDPATTPNTVDLNGPAGDVLRIPETPAAFEVRSVGTTLEIDTTLNLRDKLIQLNLAPETVNFRGNQYWREEKEPGSALETPLFGIRKATTQILVESGEWALLSSSMDSDPTEQEAKARSPKQVHLRFIRTDVSTLLGETPNPVASPETEPKTAPKPALETRTYRLSASLMRQFRLLNNLAESTDSVTDVFDDPFTGVVMDGEEKPFDPETVLKKCGIPFPAGTSAKQNEKAGTLTLKQSEEVLTAVENLFSLLQRNGEKRLYVTFEWIETEQELFSDWIQANRLSESGQVPRKEMQKWLGENRADIINTLTLTAFSANRAKVEDGREFIYPTEWLPGELPAEVSLQNGASAPLILPTPTAFETRLLGTTVEADSIISEDRNLIYINMAPEITELENMVSIPKERKDARFQVEMPIFHQQKITTNVIAEPGKATLVGTTRPIKSVRPDRKQPLVVLFVRPTLTSSASWEVVKK